MWSGCGAGPGACLEPREAREPPGLKPPPPRPPGANMPSWLGVRCIGRGLSSSRSSCLERLQQPRDQDSSRCKGSQVVLSSAKEPVPPVLTMCYRNTALQAVWGQLQGVDAKRPGTDTGALQCMLGCSQWHGLPHGRWGLPEAASVGRAAIAGRHLLRARVPVDLLQSLWALHLPPLLPAVHAQVQHVLDHELVANLHSKRYLVT